MTSLIAGYMAALVAGEYRRSTLILGIVLVIVRVAVVFMAWRGSGLVSHSVCVVAFANDDFWRPVETGELEVLCVPARLRRWY